MGTDQDTMWPETDAPVRAPGPSDEHAQQLQYLADAPEWAILPPRNVDFANATWLEAEPPVTTIVAEIFALPEFEALRAISYEVRWRRASKPFARTRDRDPLLVTVTPTDPRAQWEAKAQGCETFPHLWVDLHYQHFEDRRGQAPYYVHADEIRAHLHHALCSLAVENERVHRVHPDAVIYARTVERYGDWLAGVAAIRRAMMLIPEDR